MTASVFLAVLLAAFLHAVWNSFVKGSEDKHLTMLAVALGHVPGAAIALLWDPWIALAALPWILASVALHLGYQLFLIAGYRVGDLTLVYPIARGSAPLIVAAVSVGMLGVTLTLPQFAAVVLIALGLFALAFNKGGDGGRQFHAVAMALCTGLFIAAYSLVDGTGARLAGNAAGFWGWAAIGNAILLTLWTAITRPGFLPRLAADRSVIGAGIIGGTASFLAYGLVIWAFTQAPIALVTALRETSVVFALMIGVGILKEPLNILKVAATLITISGAILLRASAI